MKYKNYFLFLTFMILFVINSFGATQALTINDEGIVINPVNLITISNLNIKNPSKFILQDPKAGGIVTMTNRQDLMKGNSTNQAVLAFLNDFETNNSYIIWYSTDNNYAYLNWWPAHTTNVALKQNLGELIIGTPGSIAYDAKWIQHAVEHQPLYEYYQRNKYPIPGDTNCYGSVPLQWMAYYNRDISGAPLTNYSIWEGPGVQATLAGRTISGYTPGMRFRSTSTNGTAAWCFYGDTYCTPGQPNLWVFTNEVFRISAGPNRGVTSLGRNIHGQSSLQIATSTNFALDFGLEMLTHITNFSHKANFYLTNILEQTGLYEQRIFLIHAGKGLTNLTFPGGWTWMSEIPTSLSNRACMRLLVEVFGPNSNNVMCTASIGVDNTYIPPPEDSDANNYFNRANITNPDVKNAINLFVYTLKNSGIWTNLYALWPMYGEEGDGDITVATGQNLISSDFQILWNGDLANSQYHGKMGVTNTGAANSWGNTQFNPTAVGVNPTNFHMMVWIQSTNAYGPAIYTDGHAVMGNAMSGKYSILFAGSNQVSVLGPFSPDTGLMGKFTTTNPYGFLYGSGHWSLDYHNTSQMIYAGGNSPSIISDNNFALFALLHTMTIRNVATIMLSGASIGKQLSNTQIAEYYEAWNTLQLELGRKQIE
jgi:hypothetical protein